MIEENEIVSVLLCIGVLFFIIIYAVQIKRLPSSNLFLSGFYVFTLSRFFTIIENIYFYDIFHLLENASYAVSSILLLIWFWNVFVKRSNIMNERGVE